MEEYMLNAPIMKINPNNVYFGELHCLISAETDIEDVVVSALKNYLEGQAFIDDLSKQVPGFDAVYGNELININAENGILSVQILAKDEEECSVYVENVKNLLLMKSDALKENIGEHELDLIQESINCGYSYEVKEKQKECRENLTGTRNALTTVTVDLSEVERRALAKLDEINSDLITVTEPILNYKNMVVGFLVGILVGVIIVVIYTIYNGKLQTSRELSKRFDIMHIGTVSKQKDDSEEIEILATKIKRILELTNTKQIHVLSTRNVENIEQLQKVFSLLEERDIKCIYLGNILKEKQVIENLSNNVPAIVMETVGKSKVKDIYEEISHCNDLDVNVLGYISIER